jgi:RNase P subunit RPR2
MDEYTFHENDWPWGLRCTDCHRLFVQGEKYSERLTGVAMGSNAASPSPVVEITCVPCGMGLGDPLTSQ